MALRAARLGLAGALLATPPSAQGPIYDHSGDPSDHDAFGSAVAILRDGDVDGDGFVGTVLAMGAPGDSLGSGSVQLRVNDAGGNQLIAKIIPVAPPVVPGDALGVTLRNVGNLAGPAFPIDDLAIHLPGSPGVNPSAKLVRPHPLALRGKVGPNNDLYLGFYTELEGPLGSSFGGSQDGGRDVNLDGTTDVALGAVGVNAAYVASGLHLNAEFSNTVFCGLQTNCGTVYRVGGTGFPPPPPPGMVLPAVVGPAQSERFGGSVALIGDLDGDGRGELVVGDTGWNGDEGAVRIYSFDGTGWTTIYERFGGATGDLYGVVRRAGDLNGDGVDELLVGAPGTSVGGDAEVGRVECLNGARLIDGDPGNDLVWQSFGSDFYAAATTVSPAGMRYGTALEEMPDIDGDGRPEVLVGAPFEWGYGPEVQAFYDPVSSAWPTGPDTNERTGSVTMLSGDSGRVLDRWFGPDLMESGTGFLCPRSSEFGRSLASGDLDNDGDPDILVGAPADAYVPDCYFMGSAYGYDARLQHGFPLDDFSNPNVSGRVRGYGSTSVTENALTLRATQCLPNKNGMFWIASGYLGMALPSGVMMSGAIERVNVVYTTDADGEAEHLLDLTALNQVPIAAGLRIYSQFIYRDDAGSFDWTAVTSFGLQP